jgi:hypothetical protein
MPVRIDGSVLRDSKWGQYAVRFLFGGIVTAIAGLVAQHYGVNSASNISRVC